MQPESGKGGDNTLALLGHAEGEVEQCGKQP